MMSGAVQDAAHRRGRNGYWSADVVNDHCPIGKREHGIHRFKHPRGGSGHCLGWHAVHREVTISSARFHAPYLRGRNSNLIHRSARVGQVIWFPEDWYGYGGSYVAFWDVQVGCTRLMLRNPELLSAEGVKAAFPHERKAHDKITLCVKCFPTGGSPAVLS